MNFHKYLIKLITIIILFSFIYEVNAESNVKPKAVNIAIIKGDIFINNTKINTSATIDELNLQFGHYSRLKTTSMAWDSAGIKVINDKNKAGELQIFLKKRTPFKKPKLDSFGEISIDMRPIHDFSGKLIIDGFEVTNKTTLQELNKSRRGLEFNKEAIYRTYSRSYLSDPKNKSFSCTIYIKLTDGYKIYQVSRSCWDWKQYKVNSNTEKQKNITKTKDIDGFRALMDSNARKRHKKEYNLNDKQSIEFEKRLANYKAKKQKLFLEKAKEIEEKFKRGEITDKQVERLVMQLMYPNLTPEKIAEQKKSRQAIENNKEIMSKKDQAALQSGFSMMMLKDIFSGDRSDEKTIQKIVDQVKKEITD